MELRDKIINEIKQFGEHSAHNCKKAEGLYSKRRVTTEDPMGYCHREFRSEGEAMHYMMEHAEEMLHYIRKRKQERAHKEGRINNFGDVEYDMEYERDILELRRRHDEDEWEYRNRKRHMLEMYMQRLIHVSEFQWTESEFEDMTSQALMNLLVALKQGDE